MGIMNILFEHYVGNTAPDTKFSVFLFVLGSVKISKIACVHAKEDQNFMNIDPQIVLPFNT